MQYKCQNQENCCRTIRSNLRVIYTKKVRMEVEICPSCRSNALSMRRQQVEENRCTQCIECDQCAFHMEERWIAVNFHSIFHNQNIVEDILRSKMAVPISS